jgi:transposase, IS5 family
VKRPADNDPQKQAVRSKACVREKVVHLFLWIKHIFGYSKLRYHGLAKNTNRLLVLTGLTNLMLARKYLVV